MCMLSQCLCVSLVHLGLVRSQLNEVTLTITRDVCARACVCPSASVHLQYVCVGACLSVSVLLYVCVCVCASV